jgi:hypothetical protein
MSLVHFLSNLHHFGAPVVRQDMEEGVAWRLPVATAGHDRLVEGGGGVEGTEKDIDLSLERDLWRVF